MRRTWIKRADVQAHDGDELARPVQPAHPALQLQAKVGNRMASQLLAGSGAAQCMLRVGPVDDPLEREADRVADEVVRRVEASGPGGGLTSPEVEAAIGSARGGGHSLEPPVLRQMEGAFGADFGDVRVHADGQSDRLSRQLNARAFTLGSDIFFSKDEYNPTSASGRSVLAHELTHVLQQGAASVRRLRTPGAGGTVLQRTRNVPRGFTFAGLNHGQRVLLLQDFRQNHDHDHSGGVGSRWDDHIEDNHGRNANPARMPVGTPRTKFARSGQTCVDAIRYALDNPTRIIADPHGDPLVGHVECDDVNENPPIGEDPVHPPGSANRICRGITVVFDFGRLRVITAYPR